jgi:hypothetical protein
MSHTFDRTALKKVFFTGQSDIALPRLTGQSAIALPILQTGRKEDNHIF